MPAGRTLRIDLPEAARVHWSKDGWTTATDAETTDAGVGGLHVLELPTVEIALGGRVVFTWQRRGSGEWVGEDYAVEIAAASSCPQRENIPDQKPSTGV